MLEFKLRIMSHQSVVLESTREIFSLMKAHWHSPESCVNVCFEHARQAAKHIDKMPQSDTELIKRTMAQLVRYMRAAIHALLFSCPGIGQVVNSPELLAAIRARLF